LTRQVQSVDSRSSDAPMTTTKPVPQALIAPLG
jgi:hypothetical protein